MLRGKGFSVGLAAVAARARVSRQTVSNVLNAPHRVAPETAARVVRAIDELGYRPNRTARNLRRRTSSLLGLCVSHRPGDVNAIFYRFVQSLTGAAREHGYHVLLFTPDDRNGDLATYDELIRTGTVDGFALAETHTGDDRPRWLAGRGIPFACFGRPWGSEDVAPAWVDVDGAAGTHAATEHLIGHGHRDIAFLGWPPGSGTGDDRAAGWANAMVKHGLDARGMRGLAENTVESATTAATRLLAGDRVPTAFVCAHDTLAVGARRAAAAAGRPEVVAFGFDDTPVAAALTPPLSSVRQPVEQAGRVVVQLLIEQLTGAYAGREGVLLAPHLMLRGDDALITTEVKSDDH